MNAAAAARMAEFDDSASGRSDTGKTLETLLRRALARREFALEFQPLIDIASGRIAAFEALLRWRPRNRAELPPAIFVPVLEASDLIGDVGAWVIDAACRARRAWHDARMLPADCRVAINLSASQFNDHGLSEHLYRVVELYRLPPAMIEVELTESTMLPDTAAVAASLREIRDMGMNLSVDDFGTGYASFSYLKRFQLERLKIDRSFMQRIATDEQDNAIVASIVELAHGRGLKTVAEGVEQTAQLEQLQRIGCDLAQGYLFSRPLAIGSVPGFVRNWRAEGSVPDRGFPVSVSAQTLLRSMEGVL